jgi:hypothetical protein
MTAQPEEVVSAIPITVKRIPAREAFQMVNPIHTPSETAMALPPWNPKKGLKTCPRIGAMAIKYIGIPRIPRLKYENPTGAAALLTSNIRANMPTALLPDLKRFAAPGLPSPYWRTSTPEVSFPNQTEKGKEPQKKAKKTSATQVIVSFYIKLMK